MASPDRKRARGLYAASRFWAASTVGFLVATELYPGPWPVPPSTFLAVAAAVTSLVVNGWATVLWRRQ